MSKAFDPVERIASARKEFGEWGGVNASIEVSTTFTVMDASTIPAIFAGEKSPDNGGCYLYGRSYNPTVRYLSRQLAAMEDTEAAYACSSGIAAISSSFLALCATGDHIVASNAVYGGTFALLNKFLPVKCGIHTTFVDVTDLAAVEAAMTPRTKVLFTETLSNPTLVVADLPRLSALARRKGVQLVVDNTFAPLLITPSRWGADVVVHSLTKFVSGGSDIIAGAICGSAALVKQLMDLNTGPLMLLGPTLDPKVASELSLRIPHLPARMAAHCSRAAGFASRLQLLGAQVLYPGLPDHPQHTLMTRLKNEGYGFGGILGLDMGSQQHAQQLMERLQNRHGFGLMAVSLGYFDTLLSCSGASTSSELSPEERAQAGISDGYVRISAGITGSLEQRLQQLQDVYLELTCPASHSTHQQGSQPSPQRPQPNTAGGTPDGARPHSHSSWINRLKSKSVRPHTPPASDALTCSLSHQPSQQLSSQSDITATAEKAIGHTTRAQPHNSNTSISDDNAGSSPDDLLEPKAKRAKV